MIRMKRMVVVGVLLVCVLAAAVISTAAPLTPQDKEQIRWVLGSFETYLEQGNVQGILGLLSPNMPQAERDAITNDLYSRFASGGINFEYQANLTDEKITEIEPGVKYEVTGRFSVEAPNWNLSGLKATFVFERIGPYFYIAHTDVFEKMNPGEVFKFVGIIFVIIGVLGILFLGGIVVVILLIIKSQKKKKALVSAGSDGPSTV
ncbi:MAG: hypothetical protein JW885_16165 [Deltaproteobacteria bacterium]|nr:hypothetical protein [Candidatus Zymogenaceae bacterium]